MTSDRSTVETMMHIGVDEHGIPVRAWRERAAAFAAHEDASETERVADVYPDVPLVEPIEPPQRRARRRETTTIPNADDDREWCLEGTARRTGLGGLPDRVLDVRDTERYAVFSADDTLLLVPESEVTP